jgi:zinc protease
MGLAYFAGTTQLMGPTNGAFIFYVGTDPAKVDAVQKEFRDEIAKLADSGLTPEELARAKKKLLGAEAVRNQSDAAMAQAIALDELFGLGADHYQKRKAEIDAVTVDDARRVANQYFKQPGNVEVIVTPPAKK